MKTKDDCCNTTLIRLKIGDKIEVGDYCYDARVLVERGKEIPQEPVRVTRSDKYSVVSEGHHPHFRIVKSPRQVRNKKV